MRLSSEFYLQSAEILAKKLLGKVLIRTLSDGSEISLIINETEAYLGEHDLACHTSKGRTPRTEIMYHEGGVLYVYLIYGMYQMLNLVSGLKGNGEAVLIRGAGEYNGPGKLTKALQIDKNFNSESLIISNRIRIEDHGCVLSYESTPRIGVNYAGDFWKNEKLRFVALK